MSRKRIPLNQNGCTANFRIGVPFEQNLQFYLNLIVSGGFVEENINDENNFRNLIWERIICLKDKCRKYGVSQSDVRNNVERIVFERARSFVVGVDSDIVDSDILEALKSEGIVVESKNKIRLK